MLPDFSGISSAAHAEFLAPHDVAKLALQDFARGGAAIGDASAGMNIKTWELECINHGYCAPSEVYISAPDVERFLVPELTGNITSISFCFDQNMFTCFVYTLGYRFSFLYWYNTATRDYETLALGEGLRTPILRMDDIQDDAMSSREVILSYIKGDSLCVRLQRDRYAQEYTLALGGYHFIRRCGMNAARRFQWACG